MTDQDRDDLIKQSGDDYKVAVQGWEHIYKAAIDDMRFVYDVDGGQWNEQVRLERQAEGRPLVTVNKLLKFVRQQRGEMLINRPRVKVIPVDSLADVKKAELFNGIIRQIEYQSTASIAYDTAYMNAHSGSIGFWRIITDYEDDTSFNQSIFIKRIANPFSVRLDPSSQEFNFSDGRFAFIEDIISEDEFERKYPDAEGNEFSGDTRGQEDSNWFGEKTKKVAEYFYKVPIKKKLVQLSTGESIELTKDVTEELIISKGLRIVKERTIDAYKIMSLKRSGFEILEDPQEWIGKYIPIVPLFGDEIIVNGKKYYLSSIRGAKGIQEMYNYWATAATENVAQSPKTPFIIDHRQIQGFEPEWKNVNRKNTQYVRYKAIAGVMKPTREPQTGVPVAIINMMQNTSYDIEDHLGRYEASKGAASNERSKVAIDARVAQSDKGSFNFVDNFSRAIVYSGKIIIDLIPKIYDTPRALVILGETGKDSVVQVNKPVGVNAGTGQPVIENDLSVGKFDVMASAGASLGSRRAETLQIVRESMQYAPSIAPILSPFLFKYSDMEGGQEIYEEVKKAIEQLQNTQSGFQPAKST